jgi:DNA-directed RNA polymerase specialized sigma24 family protein
MNSKEDEKMEAWLAQAKGGNSSALNSLCQAAGVRLALVVKFRLRSWSQEDREDVVQAALLTFCEKIQTVEKTPMAFALWILRQKIGNELQKVRHQRERSLSELDRSGEDGGDTTTADTGLPADPDDTPEIHYLRKEQFERIVRILPLLSDFCRALLAGFLQEKAVHEMWEWFSQIEPDLNRNAFYKRIHDCRQKMTGLLGATA